jgi:endoglucanase
MNPRGSARRLLAVASAMTAVLVLGGAADSGASVSAAGRSGVAAVTASVRDEVTAFPAHTSGASIVDANGHSFRLNCVNWSGAEGPEFVPEGLNKELASTIIGEIVSLGYNCVRLPWSNEMWNLNPKPSGNTILANPQFSGQDAKTIFGEIVQDLAGAGLMIILDNHESQAGNCCNSSDSDRSWYDPSSSTYTSANWIADWKSVVATFDSIPQVVGVDLRNEPRGSDVTWGPSGTYDWHAAAEAGGDAVQSVDPHMLIFVEGVNFALDLSGVLSLPVTLTHPDQVVYEFHTYDFPPGYPPITSYNALMAKVSSASAHDYWAPLYQQVPLWLGEFGCFVSPGTAQDSCSDGNGNLGAWFGPLARYLYYHNSAWSYWELNGPPAPTGGRPYGILDYTWDAVASPDLQNALATIQPRCPADPIGNGTYYIKNSATGQVIDIPQSSTTQGTSLDEWPQNGGKNQQWNVDNIGCGLMKITSVLDGQSIDVRGASTAAGGSIQQYGYWGGGNQQLVLQPDGNSDGACTMSAINSMRDITSPFPIEVPGSSTTAGTLLDQGAPDSGTDQDWTFTNVSTGSTVTC